jgi:hypothetical protein
MQRKKNMKKRRKMQEKYRKEVKNLILAFKIGNSLREGTELSGRLSRNYLQAIFELYLTAFELIYKPSTSSME